MLELPAEIVVQLRNTQGRALPEPDVLIGLNILCGGRYYYGTLIGLTNEHGVARASGGQIAQQFAQDQREFPMDYKVDLDECDSDVEIVLLSGKEIEQARQDTAQADFVSPGIRELYQRARNGLVKPATLRVELTRATAAVALPSERLAT